MPKLRLLSIVSLSCVAGVTFLAACSDDTTNPDPIIDSGTDTNTGDTSTADTGTTDTGADTSTIDSGVTLDNIADIVSEHMCNALARCCYGNANPPDGGLDGGGSFNRAKCQALYALTGFEGSSVGHEQFKSGKVTLDSAKAADCLSKIDSLSCTVDGTSLQDVRSSCFAAVVGSVAVGQPCAQSVECASGLFCQPTDRTAGLAGTCATLATTGEACTAFNTGDPNSIDRDATEAEMACTYRGGGTPALHCDTLDPADVNNYSDETTWTCKASVANGENCDDSLWCTNGICDPATFTCVAMGEFFTKAGSCDPNVTP